MNRAARYTYPEVCHLDALIADHAAHMPGWSATADRHATWETRRDELTTARDTALAALAGILCRKCQGTGRTQWRHRLDGVCFQCNGDGWTARGRRLTNPARQEQQS